jgi:hypothetical protein
VYTHTCILLCVPAGPLDMERVAAIRRLAVVRLRFSMLATH